MRYMLARTVPPAGRAVQAPVGRRCPAAGTAGFGGCSAIHGGQVGGRPTGGVVGGEPVVGVGVPALRGQRALPGLAGVEPMTPGDNTGRHLVDGLRCRPMSAGLVVVLVGGASGAAAGAVMSGVVAGWAATRAERGRHAERRRLEVADALRHLLAEFQQAAGVASAPNGRWPAEFDRESPYVPGVPPRPRWRDVLARTVLDTKPWVSPNGLQRLQQAAVEVVGAESWRFAETFPRGDTDHQVGWARVQADVGDLFKPEGPPVAPFLDQALSCNADARGELAEQIQTRILSMISELMGSRGRRTSARCPRRAAR